jgi:hypothetical protein
VPSTLLASGASAPAGEAVPLTSGPTEKPRGGRPLRAAHPLGLVRGVLAERVVVSTLLDPYMPLKALAGYSGLSVRKLRDHLTDLAHPLPHYRIGGKVVLVRRSEFDGWIAGYRRTGREDVDTIIDDVLRGLAKKSA